MMMFQEDEVRSLRQNLKEWYQEKRRLLPWRGDTVNGIVPPPVSPYGVMISEVMLQQTRVETVISYWFRWMNTFPTIEALASASIEEVNAVWAGLGYYRRGKALWECAKIIVEKYRGEIPGDVEELLQLPGIGPYTAGAISSIAFQNPTPAVDGNVVRVFSRLRSIHQLEGIPLEKKCREIAQFVVDPVDPSCFNQALMELGATICKPQNPICEEEKQGYCPVQNICQAYKLIHKQDPVIDIEDLSPIPTSVTFFPRKVPKKAPVDHRFIVIALNVPSSTTPFHYLLSRRPPTGLLANQWEFPTVGLESDREIPNDSDWEIALSKARSFFLSVDIKLTIVRQHFDPLVHIFSHQKHHMFLFELAVDHPTLPSLTQANTENRLEWMDQNGVIEQGMTTGIKKLFAKLSKSTLSSKGNKKEDGKRGAKQLSLDSFKRQKKEDIS